METVVPISDDEREDGEIVDEFEDISESSIPSCGGKSDYSQDILRAISLSSISDNSEGAEMSPRRRHRKRHRCKSEHARRKRKRKHKDLLRTSRKRRSLSTDSSSSTSDDDKLDKRTLRQLKEAVRINQSGDLHHNSLRSRLKAMIEPDSDDEDVEALRTLALLTKNENSPKPDFKEDDNEVQDMEVDDDKDPPGEIIEKFDDTFNDKELAELRSEALKSAVIKKHMDRKKRKELDQKENNDVQNKELNSNDKENKDENDEEDEDVMRAMLLASISKRITSVPNNPTCKPAITSTPNPVVRTALQNKQTNAKPPPAPLKLPSVKPLIIRLNSDSDSDLDKSTEGNNEGKEENNPLDETVSKLLKMHREKFEMKEKEIEKNAEVNDENLLNKSVVKLLSKSQQKEYQLLKQKLLLANRKKMRRLSNRTKNLKNDEEKNVVETSSNLKETLQEMQFQKDGRLQMKGKYQELAPLIQKVNVASMKRRQCEEKIKALLGKLKEARVEHATSHENFINLVQKLKQAKENIDLRITKLATANTNSTKKLQLPASVNLKQVNLEPAPVLPTTVQANDTLISKQKLINGPEVTNKVLPIEKIDVQSNRAIDLKQTNLIQVNAVGQKKRNDGVDDKDVKPAKIQKIMNLGEIKKGENGQKATVQIQNKLEVVANLNKKIIAIETQQNKLEVQKITNLNKNIIPSNETQQNKSLQEKTMKTNSTDTQKNVFVSTKPVPTKSQIKIIPEKHNTIIPQTNGKQIVQKNIPAAVQTNISPKKTIPVLIHRTTKFQRQIIPSPNIAITLEENIQKTLKPADIQKNVVSPDIRKKLNSGKLQGKPVEKKVNAVEVGNKIDFTKNLENAVEAQKNIIPADLQNKIQVKTNPEEFQKKNIPVEEKNKMIPAEENSIPAEEQKNLISAEENNIPAVEQKNLIPAEENNIPVEEQKNLIPAEENNISVEEQKNLIPAEENNIPAEEQKNLIPAEENNIPVEEQNNLIPAEENNIPVEEQKNLIPAEENNIPVEEQKNLIPAEEKNIPVEEQTEMIPTEEKQKIPVKEKSIPVEDQMIPIEEKLKNPVKEKNISAEERRISILKVLSPIEVQVKSSIQKIIPTEIENSVNATKVVKKLDSTEIQSKDQKKTVAVKDLKNVSSTKAEVAKKLIEKNCVVEKKISSNKIQKKSVAIEVAKNDNSTNDSQVRTNTNSSEVQNETENIKNVKQPLKRQKKIVPEVIWQKLVMTGNQNKNSTEKIVEKPSQKKAIPKGSQKKVTSVKNQASTGELRKKVKQTQLASLQEINKNQELNKVSNDVIGSKTNSDNGKEINSVEVQKKGNLPKIIVPDGEMKLKSLEVQNKHIKQEEVDCRLKDKDDVRKDISENNETVVIDLTVENDDDVVICDETNECSTSIKRNMFGFKIETVLEEHLEETKNSRLLNSRREAGGKSEAPDDRNSKKFSEYISPLDKRNQNSSSNPQQMLCPYELFGTCRDQDCVFNHCP